MARDMSRDEIARILQDARVKAGLTQQQAADAIGRKRQTLASWETGQSQPDANTLFLLFDAYGASVNEAFGYNDSEEFTARDKAIIAAYRANPDMQRAVDRLLNIDEAPVAADTVRVFRAARSDDNSEAQVLDVPRARIEKLKEAKETDEI